MLLLPRELVGDFLKPTQSRRGGWGGGMGTALRDQGHATVRGDMSVPGDCNKDTKAKRNVMQL